VESHEDGEVLIVRRAAAGQRRSRHSLPGGAIELNGTDAIELELYALGTLGCGDAYLPNVRTLPNTSVDTQNRPLMDG
jgi:hypothetical protein